MFFLAEFQEAGVFKDMIRTLLASICDIVYRLIIVFYQLFMAIGDATILTSADIQKIFNRIGLILGIIMMFRLIFSFVQYLLDPDKITDKETGVGGLIKKVLVVILALGLVNWVFEKAFELQSNILEENVIGKVILGVGSSKDIDMKEFGTMFSYTLYSNFYYQNPEMSEDALKDANTKGCGSDYFDKELKNYVATFNDFEAVHKCINEEGTSNGNLFGNKIYYATYHGLEALVVGGFVLWVLIMYTITLGVRVVKLAFLRVIAPIPILSYLSPKKSSTFNNWLKQCVMTYLDLFIRIAIIYFAMLLIDIIFSRGALIGATTNFAVDGNDSMLFIGLDKWFNLILVLGVLLFAKKMPEIIGDLFPGFGGKGGLDFGIGLKSRTDFAGKGLVKRTAGAAIGAPVIGALGFAQGMKRKTINADGELVQAHGGKRLINTLTGSLTGVGRGLRYGMHGGKVLDNVKKGFRTQVGASASTNKYIAAGGDSLSSRIAATLGRELGLPTAYDELVARQKNLEALKKANEQRISQLDGAAKTSDGIVDRLGSKISGDDTKTVFGKDTPKAVYEYLEKKGIIKDVSGNGSGDWRLIKSSAVKRNADGSVKLVNGKPELEYEYGERIEGRKYHELDNMIENYRTDAQKNIEYLTEQRNKAQAAGDTAKAKSLETELTAEYDKLNSINVTEKVKRLKEAAYIHLLVGEGDSKYDDDVAKNDLATVFTQIASNVESIKKDAEKVMASTNPSDEGKKAAYKEGVEVLVKLESTMKALRDAKNDSDVETIMSGISSLDVPDFDSVDENGNFGRKKMDLDSVYDVIDNIANYQKAISRNLQRENVKHTQEITDLEQSARMVRERLADEFRIGGSSKS